MPGLEVTGVPVVHASGAPAYGLRLTGQGWTIGYSGDTEWTESLVDIADQADLFICEAYTFDKQVKYHLSYATLEQHRARLGCRRLVLTHLGPEVLGRALEAEVAEDGLVIRLGECG
jgi:ribonuclease BN (tRNA processing enzyme)